MRFIKQRNINYILKILQRKGMPACKQTGMNALNRLHALLHKHALYHVARNTLSSLHHNNTGLLATNQLHWHQRRQNNQQHKNNKKHLKNVGPICNCEPPHAHSPGVATGTVARRLRIDVHDANENAWQRGPLWPHGMGPITRGLTVDLGMYCNIGSKSTCCRLASNEL